MRQPDILVTTAISSSGKSSSMALPSETSKEAKNEGELGIIHGKARLKLNYTKNPSFRRASKPLPNQSSMQGRESEKESNIQQLPNPLPNAQEGILQALRN